MAVLSTHMTMKVRSKMHSVLSHRISKYLRIVNSIRVLRCIKVAPPFHRSLSFSMIHEDYREGKGILSNEIGVSTAFDS